MNFNIKQVSTSFHKTCLKPTFMDSFMYLQYRELQKKISSKMAAMAVILNHATQKIDRCATLNPLKQPEPKTKEISQKKGQYFPKSKMSTAGHFGSNHTKNE